MTVGVPGFVCAVLVARPHDPSCALEAHGARFCETSTRRDGAAAAAWPLGSGGRRWGGGWWLEHDYGADSRLTWRRARRSGLGLRAPSSGGCAAPCRGGGDVRLETGISSAFDEILHAGRTVLHTPTLVYALAGAMIWFGTNGIVGWGRAVPASWA
jgi:hypothetical protein